LEIIRACSPPSIRKRVHYF